MTLQDLKEKIDDLCDGYENPENIKIMVGFQPSYPLRANIANICTRHGKTDDDDEIWIAISDGFGYGVPREIWDEDDIYDDDDE